MECEMCGKDVTALCGVSACKKCREAICGRKVVVIGLSADAQEALDYSVSDEFKVERKKITSLLQKIIRLRRAGFWTRMKWLFTGVDR